jgi:pyruvate,orthophosphate dikinase
MDGGTPKEEDMNTTETETTAASSRPATLGERFVYFFGNGQADGSGDMKDLLGGKGAGLAEMTNAGVPVPPGFTITTAVCRHHQRAKGQLPEGFAAEQDAAIAQLERAIGKRLGDENDPLLVSVRSGAKFSMPGMMDTILNLGLNDRSVRALATRTGNARFAWDCYRRFIQMFSSVVMDLDKAEFEHLIEALKHKRKVKLDTELTAADLESLTAEFKRHVRRRKNRDFPQDAREQLAMARDAVFRSWDNDRAIYYRRQNGIPDDLGTAVNVQAMVFGNRGDTSGTGVGFTRNPSTGENHFYGEYLTNAQGEDVVAGVRTPQPIEHLKREMPEVYRQLHDITKRLEQHYRDVQDFEFTIEDGTLYLLQTRNGKRTAQAAVRIAMDMLKEKMITEQEAVLRVDAASLDQLLHPRLDPEAKVNVIANGLSASPGAAVGMAVFDADTAAEWASEKKKVILVRKETTPDDIHGMDAAQGILTAKGGMTSHAAVVARGMGKPCVCGATAIHVDPKARVMTVDRTVVKQGDWITLDGSAGTVMRGAVPTIDAEISGEFQSFMAIADKYRRLKVRSNSDIPRDAIKAREFGGEGIGLCRTEHMFFAEDRLAHVVQMILAAPLVKERRQQLEARTKEHEKLLASPPQAGHGAAADRKAAAKHKLALAALQSEIQQIQKELALQTKAYHGALAKLLPFQRKDFHGLFKAMSGYPVTIRTLDPPLHEFLPKREELMVDIERHPRAKPAHRQEMAKRYRLTVAQLAKGMPELLKRVEGLHEFNPMLGHRGCRLGITYPEITEMQARAIFEAACEVTAKGGTVVPEVMIPLVGTVEELADQAAIVRRVAEETMAKKNVRLDYLVGTMIEVPRAAVTAERIAGVAEFFSFGTNDLTQMAFGFSRDDAGKFLPEYVERKVLPSDPFVTIDQDGVGALMAMAVQGGRRGRSGLKLGICGEHGGDPQSVEFCHRIGLDYVSCSPFRVPIARLAAAQAALRGSAKESDRR